MSELSNRTADLDADLRAYLAVIASTALPPLVRRMSVRTLQDRSSGRRIGWFAGSFGLLAAAALAFVVIAHPGTQGASSGNSSFSGVAGRESPALARPLQGTLTYPGVDSSKLAASGVLLLVPDVHGTVALTPVQAQAVATQALGQAAGSPGPAVLATVNLQNGQAPSTCLCWVVDVPVVAGEAQVQPSSASPRTELVLVDAGTGRVVAVLHANGIP